MGNSYNRSGNSIRQSVIVFQDPTMLYSKTHDSDQKKMKYSYPNSKDTENLSYTECTQIQFDTDILTLEGLRRQYNSCTECGVCWYDNHVNLDCSECGGYAMCRPCPKCNGQCGVEWKRDVRASHRNNKAEWVGSCSLDFQWNSTNILDSNNLSGEDKNANNIENSYLCVSPKSKTFMNA